MTNNGWFISGTNDGDTFGFKLEELSGFSAVCTARSDKKQLTEYNIEMIFKGGQRLSVQGVNEITVDDIESILQA